MKSLSLLAVALLIIALQAFSIQIKYGAGQPEVEGWCPLGWHAGTLCGHGGLTEQGLELYRTTPPVTAYELNLKMIPFPSLLFSLRSPNTAGTIDVWLDGKLVDQITPPGEGAWWLRLDDLPERGFLRLELGKYCDSLLIQSIYFPCAACPLPDCRLYLLLGALLGAGLVLLLCLILR